MQRTTGRGARAQPDEGGGVIRVEAELAAPARVGDAVLLGPRVLAARVEARASQVEAVAAAVVGHHLGLEAGQQAQRLRVALEAADVGGPLVEGALAVVTERRVAEVVGEAGGVHDIRIQSQPHRQLAPDLRDLERVRQAIAGEVDGRGGGAQHLGLHGEAPQGARVQHAGAIAGEVAAAGRVLLGEPALAVGGAVAAGQLGAARSATTVAQFGLGELGAVGLLQFAALEPAVGQARDLRGAGAAALALGVDARVRLVVVEAGEQLVDLVEARRARERRPQLAADRVALEVPGDVLADVAAGPVLVVEELDEQLGVALEGGGDLAEGRLAP